jgi:hypothetical protein
MLPEPSRVSVEESEKSYHANGPENGGGNGPRRWFSIGWMSGEDGQKEAVTASPDGEPAYAVPGVVGVDPYEVCVADRERYGVAR